MDLKILTFYSMILISPKNMQIRKFESIISRTKIKLKNIRRFSLELVRFIIIPKIVLCSFTALYTMIIGITIDNNEYAKNI